MKWTSDLIEDFSKLTKKQIKRELEISRIIGGNEFPDFYPFYDYNDQLGIKACNLPFNLTDVEYSEIELIRDSPVRILSCVDWSFLVSNDSNIWNSMEQMFLTMSLNQYSVVACGRQMGSSTAAHLSLIQRLLVSKSNILFVSHQSRSSNDNFEKLIHMYLSIPFFMRPGVESIVPRRLVKFENGGSISFAAQQRTSGFGCDYDTIVLSDFAYLEDKLTRKLINDLIVKGDKRIIVFSTPSQSSGYFGELFRSDNSFAKCFIPDSQSKSSFS